MYYFQCNLCHAVFEVDGHEEEIRQLVFDHVFWSNGYPCINTCGGKLRHLTDKEKEESQYHPECKLTPKAFFRALCGLGKPSEIGCTPEVIRAFLLSSKIVDVAVGLSNSNRVILRRLDLDNGTSLHVASSAHDGAVIYKVTRSCDERSQDTRNIGEETKNRTLQNGLNDK